MVLRTTQTPRRRRVWFFAMLGVSLALHIALVRWLAKSPAAQKPPRVTEFTLVYPKPEKPAPPVASARRSRAPRTITRPSGETKEPTQAPVASSVSGTVAVPSVDAPRAAVVQPLSLAQLGAIHSDAWQGTSQHEAAPAQTLAEKNAEGTARVQGWLIASGARERVERGAIHPYFNELGTALRETSKNPPAFSGQHSLLGSFGRAYLASAAAYHNPGVAAGDPREDGRIVALVELRQSAEGAFVASLLLESSGSPGFDAHVLNALPAAATQLRAPLLDEGGLHPHGLRSVWAFEGSVREVVDTAQAHLQAKNLPLALLAPIGLLGGSVDPKQALAGALGMLRTVYDCTPRLVAVY